MVVRSSRTSTRWGRMNAPAAALASEQRGPIARTQLLQLGWSRTTIDRRIAEGLLPVLWPGVYGYGHRALTRDGWLCAAALAGGDGARLVARASASARRLLTSWSRVDVGTSSKRGGQLDGIRLHRLDLRPAELDLHRGLPVTTLARTALDIARTEPPDRVGELLDEALLRDQYDHAEMTALLDDRRGCRGVAILRHAVLALGDEGVVFRSRPERLARDAIRAAGLPEPRVNAWFPTRNGHGHELDLWWPGLRLNFEIDGPRHRLPHQRRKDALRDADLRALGVTVVRVPDTLVTGAIDAFVARVADSLTLSADQAPPSGGSWALTPWAW